MKKFVFYFICHIGCVAALFNPHAVKAEDYLLASSYEIQNYVAPVEEKDEEKKAKPRSIIETDNELFKLVLIPFLVDKLYPEGKINEDLSGFLHLIYPQTDVEKLKTLEPYIKFFVSAKRRYTYVVNLLEQKVKALALLPADAPIVAGDGEYAPEVTDARKQTPQGEYGVSYTEYKYLEYDPGETGEPVRRRDKNYVEEPDLSEEIALAILKFDLPAFYRALKKFPTYNDGSAEKTVKLPSGIQARLLLDVSEPGEQEKIRGVIDLYVPKGHYINGDYLNLAARPHFFLNEDKSDNHNIKSYQLFHPAPAGVDAGGHAKRIYTGSVRFPIEFTRADVSKGIKINGTFNFELCDAESRCQSVAVRHGMSLKPSDNHVFSIYNNYVMQGFAHLPRETSSHAELKDISYSPQTGRLKVRFDTTRRFANVAVMAENKSGADFTHPRYAISDNEIVAEFDNTSAAVQADPGEIAVTAVFNDFESLRKVARPQIIADETQFARRGFSRPGWFSAFMFGLYLNLMPGILYLFVRLIKMFWQQKYRFRIFLRYALGTASGLAFLCAVYHKRYFAEMYENAFIAAAAGLIAVSFVMECLRFMDFELFRPLKRFARRGFFIGFFSALFIAAFPMYNAAYTLSRAFEFSTPQLFLFASGIWAGMLFLPLLILLFSRPNYYILAMARRFSVFYNLLFIVGIIFLLYMSRGTGAALIAAISFALMAGLWYVYPFALQEAAKQTRSVKRQADIFNRLQKHALTAVIVIFILTAGTISLFSPKKPLLAPSPAQVTAMAKSYNSRNIPVLVAVTADWSVISYFNNRDISRIKNAGIKVIRIQTAGSAANAALWFKTYGVDYAPLNVLFTPRHPQGLVLPEKLQLLNWQAALAELNGNKNERTVNHD